MKRLFGIALGGCALAALVLFAGAPAAEAKCGKASASGIGLGPEMAKEMAKMNLAAGLEEKKMKAKGKVSYSCSGPFMSECKASQRAC
jgi:hypothetical protein